MIIKKVSRIKSEDETGKEIGSGITMELENGSETKVDCKTLRMNCPCATCTEERAKNAATNARKSRSSLLRVVEGDVSDQLDLVKIWPVGNYALGVRWGDGHDTGIYPFSVLFNLSKSQ